MPDTQSDRVGDVLLGKLEIVRQIGGGGMGAVYEVKHLLTGHHRALKVVQKRYADQKRFMTRLMREARVAGQLKSPYVVETLDAGRLEDGAAYILMELLEGRSLLRLIRSEERLTVPVVAHIMGQVCQGIMVAHEAGIVHRDLKPENIFLVRHADESESVKLLDFGISKFPVHLQEAPDRLTAEGTILGTPFYMSPEQAAGKNIDELTDIYAIGVMMYEALTGRLPFEAKTVGALFFKIGAGDYFPIRHYVPDIDPAFEAIVHRAIAKEPTERFASAKELREAILAFAEGGEVELRESSPGRKWSSVPPVMDDETAASADAILDTFSREGDDDPGAPATATTRSSDPSGREGSDGARPRSPVFLALAGAAVVAAILVSSLATEGGDQASGVVDAPPPLADGAPEDPEDSSLGNSETSPPPSSEPVAPVNVEASETTTAIAPAAPTEIEADAGPEVEPEAPPPVAPTTMRRPNTKRTEDGLYRNPYKPGGKVR